MESYKNNENDSLLSDLKEQNVTPNIENEIQILNFLNTTDKKSLLLEYLKSFILNFIIMCFSLIKILFSIYFLKKAKVICSEPLDLWLKITIINEMIEITYLLGSIIIHTIIYKNKLNCLNGKSTNPKYIIDNINDLSFLTNISENDSFSRILNSLDSYNFLSTLNYKAEKINFFLIILRHLNQFSYLVLFVWGCFLITNKISDCDHINPRLFQFCQILLYISFIYIFMPLMILIIVCFFIPFLLIITLCFKKIEKIGCEKNVISVLERKEFDEKIYFEHDECIICKANFEKSEKLIILPCNKKHYFHENCVEKWLEINSLCPICRTNINKNSNLPCFDNSDRDYSVSFFNNE